MAQLVTLALYDRGSLSKGHSRKVFGHKAFHWGVLILPKEPAPGRNAHAFEATDVAEIDPVTFRMQNPTMDWWFHARLNVDPELSRKLLGQLVIGEIPEGVSPGALEAFFGNVPMPAKNTDPQESCVTWSVNAVEAMQKEGWAWACDLNRLKDDALAYADDRIQGDKAKEPKLKYYGGDGKSKPVR